MNSTNIWDVIVVGGGPAGLTAALYSARFRRSTLVLDSGSGRWHYGQLNENYPGFPGGIHADELRDRILEQTEKFGAAFKSEKLISVELSEDSKHFIIDSSTGERYFARTLIWATGVKDRWPENINVEEHVGHVVFWCIVCDGWKCLGKHVLIVADEHSSTETILQYLDYTDRITVVNEEGEARLSEESLETLQQNGIECIDAHITRVDAEGESINTVFLSNGESIKPDIIFGLLGSKPNTELVRDLPIEFSLRNHVVIDDKNKTNLTNFFAAGDVTNKHGHQIVSAVHEGSMAAQAANYYLFKRERE